jgi:hypothetical protein
MQNFAAAEQAMRLGQSAYPYAQSMKDAIGSQIASNGKLSDPPCIREQVQEANKRLAGVLGSMGFLAGALVQPSTLSGGIEAAECPGECTLAGEVSELIRTINHIELHMSRISKAILG